MRMSALRSLKFRLLGFVHENMGTTCHVTLLTTCLVQVNLGSVSLFVFKGNYFFLTRMLMWCLKTTKYI